MDESDPGALQTPRPPSTPVRLQVPDIKVDTPLEVVGTDPAGRIGAPPLQRAQTAAWFNGSVMPGSAGSGVIVGHVDDAHARGVFFRLSELKPGQRILVGRADGTTAAFEVQSRQYVSKTRFPTTRVMQTGAEAGLRLITCAPPFDQRNHQYLSNLIIYAHLVAWT
ncbi:class F sortase [Kitasatospora sp. NPDC001664]